MADEKTTPRRPAGPGEISEETGQPAGGPIGPNVTGVGPVAGAPGEETAAPGENPVVGMTGEIDPNDTAALRRRVQELEARLGERSSIAELEDDDGSHECAICGAKFTDQGALGQYKQHMASFHPGTEQAPVRRLDAERQTDVERRVAAPQAAK